MVTSACARFGAHKWQHDTYQHWYIEEDDQMEL